MQVARLTDRVWQHISWKTLPKWGRVPANGLVVVGPSGAVLVDATWSAAQFGVLRRWVVDTLKVPVVAILVTHAHDDRMG